LIEGTVSSDGVPTIELSVVGQTFSAIVDTGFNGDVELPLTLRHLLHAKYLGKTVSELAAGQTIEEEVYRVTFPFDGRRIRSQATFVPGTQILIGTYLLRDYRLEIDFKSRKLTLVRQGSERPS
jgi:predicted aspartyl protease